MLFRYPYQAVFGVRDKQGKLKRSQTGKSVGQLVSLPLIHPLASQPASQLTSQGVRLLGILPVLQPACEPGHQ